MKTLLIFLVVYFVGVLAQSSDFDEVDQYIELLKAKLTKNYSYDDDGNVTPPPENSPSPPVSHARNEHIAVTSSPEKPRGSGTPRQAQDDLAGAAASERGRSTAKVSPEHPTLSPREMSAVRHKPSRLGPIREEDDPSVPSSQWPASRPGTEHPKYKGEDRTAKDYSSLSRPEAEHPKYKGEERTAKDYSSVSRPEAEHPKYEGEERMAKDYSSVSRPEAEHPKYKGEERTAKDYSSLSRPEADHPKYNGDERTAKDYSSVSRPEAEHPKYKDQERTAKDYSSPSRPEADHPKYKGEERTANDYSSLSRPEVDHPKYGGEQRTAKDYSSASRLDTGYPNHKPRLEHHGSGTQLEPSVQDTRPSNSRVQEPIPKDYLSALPLKADLRRIQQDNNGLHSLSSIAASRVSSGLPPEYLEHSKLPETEIQGKAIETQILPPEKPFSQKDGIFDTTKIPSQMELLAVYYFNKLNDYVPLKEAIDLVPGQPDMNKLVIVYVTFSAFFLIKSRLRGRNGQVDLENLRRLIKETNDLVKKESKRAASFQEEFRKEREHRGLEDRGKALEELKAAIFELQGMFHFLATSVARLVPDTDSNASNADEEDVSKLPSAIDVPTEAAQDKASSPLSAMPEEHRPVFLASGSIQSERQSFSLGPSNQRPPLPQGRQLSPGTHPLRPSAPQAESVPSIDQTAMVVGPTSVPTREEPPAPSQRAPSPPRAVGPTKAVAHAAAPPLQRPTWPSQPPLPARPLPISTPLPGSVASPSTNTPPAPSLQQRPVPPPLSSGVALNDPDAPEGPQVAPKVEVSEDALKPPQRAAPSWAQRRANMPVRRAPPKPINAVTDPFA